ncbi:hypothetical protein ACFO25_16900 [Paenactinomyces guangxiensis]|uniref:Uncharacterized protein n=1 Tax=Paenactinomyces guangxiensis TaxID=1490290 RepID=A0A7W1WV67_9BACL|nr:hypothetical protein [Paenactinomyces guangxiensis]MBA4496436.1 hypothetical protein [Paenactinomyces guangxiensis]MBH8593537.1 hypothetical protein [Paenactinomyces guangxiensis]
MGFGTVYADPGFEIPRVDDHFDPVEKGPLPQKTEPNQNAQEEGGFWNEIGRKFDHAWETLSDLWKWMRKVPANYWEKAIKEGDFWAWTLGFITAYVVVRIGTGKGLVNALVDALKGILNVIRNPKETWDNTIYAINHPIETLTAMWKSISDSFKRDVIKGDPGTASRWGGNAIGQILLSFAGTKGVDKVKNIATGSKIAQKVSSKVSNSTLKGNGQNSKTRFTNLWRGKKINGKMAVFSGLAGIAMVVAGFTIPFMKPVINKTTASVKNVVSKINQLPDPSSLRLARTNEGPATLIPTKTIGDTAFGEWMQKFASKGETQGTGNTDLSKINITTQDANRIMSRLSKSGVGKQIEAYIKRGDFTEVPGYRDLLLQLKDPKMHDSVLQALQVGERIQKSSKGKLFFESKGPNYDIDVGDKLPDGTLNNVYQLKTVDTNKSVSKNITKAAKQLVNAPANNKIIEIQVKDGTWDEFQAQGRVQGIEETFADHYPGIKVNIIFSDGVTKSWLF